MTTTRELIESAYDEAESAVADLKQARAELDGLLEPLVGGTHAVAGAQAIRDSIEALITLKVTIFVELMMKAMDTHEAAGKKPGEA